MQRQSSFLKNEKRYLVLFLITFFIANSLVLATSVLMEHKATGDWPAPFALWEPFSWEFTSSLVLVCLIPFVAWVIDSGKFSWSAPWGNVKAFLVWSLVFSILHVVGMVVLREVIYWFMGSDYRFGSWLFGFVYEYRKDAISFFLLLIIIQGYRSFVLRLRGEAAVVREGEDGRSLADRILVKKLGSEFVLKVEELEWIESAGNYVNLHLKGRVYPLRSTMERFIEDVVHQGFARTHRSYAVSVDFIEAIEAPSGQSGEVVLKNGQRIPLSKRYNLILRDRLSLSG